MINVLDRKRDPEAVVDALARYCSELRAGSVNSDELVRKHRVSKPLDEYTQSTRGTVALERAERLGFDRYPGQDVEYIVVNDHASGGERVRLSFEDCERYDAGFYEDIAIRACEAVVSPLGCRRDDIHEHLTGMRDVQLTGISDAIRVRSMQSIRSRQ